MAINGQLTFPDVPGRISEHNQSPTAHSVRIDNTLTQSGMAADAKATRDLIENVSGQIDEEIDDLDEQVTDLKSAITETTRNLFNINDVPEKAGITNIDGVLTGTASAFNSAFNTNTSGLNPDLVFEQETQYVLSFEAKNDAGGTGNGLVIVFYYTDGTVGNVACENSMTEYSAKYSISASGKTLSKICAGYMSSGAYVWHIKNIQIEKGTVKSNYIPHITAEDFFIRELVNVNTDDISDLHESVSTINGNISSLSTSVNNNKTSITQQVESYNSYNVFSPTLNTTKNGLTITGGNGSITLNGTLSSSDYFDILTVTDFTKEIKAGRDYYFDTGLRNEQYDGKFVIYYNTGSGYVKTYDHVVGVMRIKIPSNCTNMLVRFYPIIGTSYSNKTIRITLTNNLPLYYHNNYAEFRFLRAFGTGDSTIIKFKDGTTLVIDFGLNEPQGTLQSSWTTAIGELSITHIDYAIISHYHSDHLGMLLSGTATSLIDGETVFFLPNGHAFTQTELDALEWVDEMASDTIVNNYTSIMSILSTAGCKLVYPAENDTWYIGGAEVKFWNADQQYIMDQFIAHTMYDYNNASLCNYITIGSQRVCFSGDIGLPVMEHHNKTVLPSQIFKVNHHSMGYNVVPIFLNSLMPEIDITMLGYNLAIGDLGTNPNQAWCEANFVPNVVTGINNKTLSIKVTEDGYIWNTSCRKCICEDEGISGS